jgi:hypothetical protein
MGDWWRQEIGRAVARPVVRSRRWRRFLGSEICNSFLGTENSGCEPNDSSDRRVA